MNIIVLSLSLVSLASAAGSAEREIIARQARKIQSQADEIKALKKADMRRRLMDDGGSEGYIDDDSYESDESEYIAPAPAPAPAPSGGSNLTDFQLEWENFVHTMEERKANFAAASEEEEELDLETPPRTRKNSPPTTTKTLDGIARCANESGISPSKLGPVPAFGRFVNAMQNETKYPTEALDCMICSISRMYTEHMSGLIGEEVLNTTDSDASEEQKTFNPLVVMAPDKWLNDEDCYDMIKPDQAFCNGLTTCAMRLPTFGDLKITAAGDQNEADSMTKVYTAEAAMEYFELGLPVGSFNFIMSRFFERTDNEIVFDQEEWGAVRGSLDLTYTTHGADCGGGTDESSGGSNIAASENLQEIPSAAALAGPECSQRRRRRLQTQIPNGLS